MTAAQTPELWLVVGDGEGTGDTRLCRSIEAIVDFLLAECGTDYTGDEAATRAYWRELLADEDNWMLADGYGRWRYQTDIGETGHILIQRIQPDPLITAAPELLNLAVQYASECGECSGEGVIAASGVEGSADADCVECKFIRDVIAKAVAA